MRVVPGARLAPLPTAAFVAALLGLCACQPEAPPIGPEDTCVKACETRLDGCSPRECRRGCNLVVDRLVEREGDHVLACVAKAASAPPPAGSGEKACGDRAWARCAIRIGAYADGGPPPPPPPPDDVFEDE